VKGGNISADKFESDGSQGEKQAVGDRGEKGKSVDPSLMVTCPTVDEAEFATRPRLVCGALIDTLTRPFGSEPDLGAKRTRSTPPSRVSGPSMRVGRITNDGLDYNDTISLYEERRGADSVFGKEVTHVQATHNKGIPRRGRSRKIREKSKNPNSNKLGMPKFLKLGEALKDVGGKFRKKKKGVESEGSSTVAPMAGGSAIRCVPDEGSSCFVVPETVEGPILEVILPVIQNAPRSGLSLLQQGEGEARVSPQRVANSNALKLLHIQQRVGFVYKEADEEVVQVLVQEEQRDKIKKQEWEQRQVSQ
jgi:hypothetical protein